MWSIKRIKGWYALRWNNSIVDWFKSEKDAIIAKNELEFENV